MLVYQPSEKVQYIINEYWLLLPIFLGLDLAIIYAVKRNRRQRRTIQRRQKHLKLLRILNVVFAHGSILGVPYGGDLQSCVALNPERVQLDYLLDCICQFPPGVHYLNNKRFVYLIKNLGINNIFLPLTRKAKKQIIFITVSALCQLIRTYGVYGATGEVQLIIGDFGLTDFRILVKKAIASGLATSILPVLFLLPGLPGYALAAALFTGGLRVAFTSTDAFGLATELIDRSVDLKKLKPRIPYTQDVIVLNDGNRKCNMMISYKDDPNSINLWSLFRRDIGSTTTGLNQPTVVNDIQYSDVINMQDIQNMPETIFDDVRDIGIKKPRAKFVNFLDKFKDIDPIPDDETWSVEPNSQRPNLRGSIRNEL